MTKLMEWLLGVGLLFAIWVTVVWELVENIPEMVYNIVLPLPLILIFGFGFYSIGVIVYRVITFNDCVDAAKELKRQIEEAKVDLTQKGIKFT